MPTAMQWHYFSGAVCHRLHRDQQQQHGAGYSGADCGRVGPTAPHHIHGFDAVHVAKEATTIGKIYRSSEANKNARYKSL